MAGYAAVVLAGALGFAIWLWPYGNEDGWDKWASLAIGVLFGLFLVTITTAVWRCDGV